MYDIIIRNGLIYDGSGGPALYNDIAIRDGIVARVANTIDQPAGRVIDAKGKIVIPGFVDVHTHYDGQATWDHHLNPSSNLGTTTVVLGNCGVGFAPCRQDDHKVLVDLMEGVEEIPGTAMDEGLPWNWESFPEYLDALEARDRDIDVAALFPHGPLRVYVMGERGVNREPANQDDIVKMKKLIKEGVDAGAVGLSTSRTLVHRSSTGNFIPTYKASTDELKQLGQALSGTKGNVFQMISDWEDAEDEFSILREIAEKTGAKATFTLLDNPQMQPNLRSDQLQRCEKAQQDGLDIRAQVLSRPIGLLQGHPASFSTFYDRPTMVAIMNNENLTWEEKLNRLSNPDIKQQILDEKNQDPHMMIQMFGQSFKRMFPLEDPLDYLPASEHSVSSLAEREGRDPEEWLYDYYLREDGQALVYLPAANVSQHYPEMLKHPFTVSALGDGGAHVGSICDTSAILYTLITWVREREEIELPTAINILCRQPAELFSLFDRGLISEGYKADINVIDYESLRLRTPHIVHDLPAGGSRFLQHSDGIELTIKSGEVIYENGIATGVLPGQLLRGRQDEPQPSQN